MKTNWKVNLFRIPGRLMTSLLAATALFMSACSGGEFYDETSGWERDSFDEADDDLVIIEGDIVMRRSQLTDELGTIEKGFSSGTKIDKSRLKSIAINIAFDVDPGWEAAFLHAAREWNSTTIVNISETNTGDVIRVVNGSLSDAIADASSPRSGRVGNRIRVDPRFNDNRTVSQKRKTAMHEIGHTLGLAHPGDGTHISGTSSSLQQISVMRTSKSGIATVRGDTLTEEDRRSLDGLYLGPNAVCKRAADRGCARSRGGFGCNEAQRRCARLAFVPSVPR